MLKKYLNKRNLLMLIIMILSGLSIYMIFLPFISIANSLTADVNTHGFISQISRTISSGDNIALFSIISTLLVIQMVMSFLWIHFYSDKKWFGYLGFIGGGLGIHWVAYAIILMKKATIWLIKYLEEKHEGKLFKEKGIKSKQHKKINFIFLGKVTTAISIPSLIIAAPIFVLAFKTNDRVFDVQKLELSENSKAINVIEIYTDALDRNYSEECIVPNNKELKDFTLYNNFLDAGNFTHLSKPMLDEGIENNPFEITQKHIEDNLGPMNEPTYKKFVYTNVFGKNKLFSDSIKRDQFSMKYISNYINVAKTSTYSPSTSGSKVVAQEMGETTKGMNFLTAKRLETNGWGTSELTPDMMIQKQMFKNANITTNKKGGYLYMHDLVVHGPYYTNPEGKLDVDIKNTEEVYKGYNYYLSHVIANLKKKNVYDNSLIMVYGDHGNHGNPYWNTKNISSLKYSNKPLSALFIKFPHETKTGVKINRDNLVYGPWLKQAMNKYVENYIAADGSPAYDSEDIAHEVIDKDDHFKMDSKRNFPLFVTNHSCTLLHFEDVNSKWMLTHTTNDELTGDKKYDKLGNTFFSNSKANRAMLLNEYTYDHYNGGVV